MSKNFNGIKYLIVGAIFAVGFLSGPPTVQAATTVYFDSENSAVYAGDTFLVNIKISTPDTPINAVDGTILYDNSVLEIKEISTGNSLLTLWPKPPTFSNESGSLSFVGGVSGGFQSDGGNILRIVFIAKSEGEAKIDFLDGFSIFLNDGQGTSINPWLRPLSLNISKRPAEIPAKDEWQDLIEKDKISPEFVEAIIGQDSFLFDNQYFVSFFAIDKESGIAYYEIKEGDRGFIRAESPYLLKDQSLKETVQIKAVDKAGNESMAIPKLVPVPTTGVSYKTYLIWALVVLAILAFVFWLWRIWAAKLRRNIQK
ncbi:MAG: cohesin domain-containing protein [bacterium]|nr:cohesin domain-containing protein [bacterium]